MTSSENSRPFGVGSGFEAPVKALSDREGSIRDVGRWAVDDAEGVRGFIQM